MLAALALSAAVAAASSVPTILHLRCFLGKNVEQNRFALLIDRKALSMTVSSDNFGTTTIPVLIEPELIVGRGPIHYNLSTYEIAIPKLTIRVTTIPHIWPGSPPKLITEGRCARISPVE